MPNVNQSRTNLWNSEAIDLVLRLVFIGLLLTWSFNIVRPFIGLIVWGMIIAVATYPIYQWVAKCLGKRNILASVIYTVLMLALLLTPSVKLAMNMVDTAQVVNERWEQGELSVPPPPKIVKGWPLIGEKLHAFWLAASRDLEKTLVKHKDQVNALTNKLLASVAGAGFGVLQFAFSIIVAGMFLANAERCKAFSSNLAVRLAGERGRAFTLLASSTISSVAKGVLGIAFIQALLGGIGMMLMDIPAAGLWAIAVLILAVVQLPPIIILGPVAAYAFSIHETTPAVIFTVWCIIVSMSDGILKPMLLGRGLSTPMLVILVGAIGGMLLSGIIGLFVGSVVLALAYEMFKAWLYANNVAVDDDEPDAVIEKA